MSKYKILWIEDDTDMMIYIVKSIERLGIEIEIIETVSEFNNCEKQLNDYDLIILDIFIPYDKSNFTIDIPAGVNIIDRIRNVLRSDIPIIVFTVVTSENIINELYRHNVSDIIFKPARREKLINSIFSTLEE